MTDKFTDKNGGLMAGHSERWANKNRRPTSHDAGQGSKGSRNMGTGMQGKLNTMPSTGIDTTKMNPNDKLKYFKSLGLMPGSEPTPEPEVQKDPVHNDRNKVQALTQDLQKVFADRPNYLHSIVQQLKSVPPAQFKKAVFAAYRAMQEATAQSNDPDAVLSHIQSAIDNSTYED